MAKVYPFSGLRYNTEKVSLFDVVAPPYDIISPEIQDALYNKSEYNIVRADFGKEFPEDNDTVNKYTRSGELFEKWLKEDIIKAEDTPCFYIYEQVFSSNNSKYSLKGLYSLVQLCDFKENIVLPHEETLSKAKADRFELMKTTNANLSAIYSLYLDEDKSMQEFIEVLSQGNPDLSFGTEDGVGHNVWIVKDKEATDKITAFFSDKQVFIADGHHRYETALRYRDYMREQTGDMSEDAPFNYVMMLLTSMSDPGLLVFPTHRMIKDMPDFDEESIVSALTDNFSISKIRFTDGEYDEIIMSKLRNCGDEIQFAMYTGKDYYYLLRLKDVSIMDSYISDKPEVYRRLDVSCLHTLILDRHFGINMENMAQQKNLLYSRDSKEAIGAVQEGKCHCSFLINATKISQIKDISLLGEKMPQKSTYFWPKPVTGVLFNSLG
ncbi:MAG: DUF1015 domain-containing protein [Clostridia bacterium]|nr:DUF1015 domain-containing protein [Clostridia bacterium]